MIKKTFNKLNIDVYEETLKNGLKIFVAPIKDKNNFYVTFTTKYGSLINEFIPIGENKFVKVPDGVAHFLEHKVFEQEDGIDPFSFFSERGADCNANTSFYKTTYLFSGSSFYDECLTYLLNYVTSPYFTDENVLKEKGIIEQEIKMYDDDPYSKLFDTILENCFVKNNIRIPIGGTVKSIYEITKEDLYKCYNTFYHPSNMFVVVVGNVDVKETIKIINDFYKTKQYEKPQKIEIKKYDEPDNVYKEYSELNMNVTIPKVSINYKINTTLSKLDLCKKNLYLKIFLDSKFGSTSLFLENIKKENIINYDLSYDVNNTDTHSLITFAAETKEQDKLIKCIEEEMKDVNITKEELERKKKVIIASMVYMSDNIYNINDSIVRDIVKYDEVVYNILDVVNSLNIDEYNKFINTINFDNKNITVLNPK